MQRVFKIKNNKVDGVIDFASKGKAKKFIKQTKDFAFTNTEWLFAEDFYKRRSGVFNRPTKA